MEAHHIPLAPFYNYVKFGGKRLRFRWWNGEVRAKNDAFLNDHHKFSLFLGAGRGMMTFPDFAITPIKKFLLASYLLSSLAFWQKKNLIDDFLGNMIPWSGVQMDYQSHFDHEIRQIGWVSSCLLRMLLSNDDTHQWVTILLYYCTVLLFYCTCRRLAVVRLERGWLYL